MKKSNFIKKVIICIYIFFLLILLTILYYNPHKWFDILTIFLTSILFPFLMSIIKKLNKKRNLLNSLYAENIPSHFIDRTKALEEIIKKINNNNKIIFISGGNGIGKTFFLLKVYQEITENKYKFYSNKLFPIYLELNDDISIEQAIMNKIKLEENNYSCKEIIQRLRKITKNDIVILVDNNSTNNYQNMMSFVESLQELDNGLIFIISTYTSSPNLYENNIELEKFSIKEVNEMASEYNLNIPHEISETIFNYSNGIPILIKILLFNQKVVNNSHNSIPAQNYIHEICQRLDKNSLEMLKTVSFFNILEEPMNYSLFRGININFKKNNLRILKERGLINSTNDKIIINNYIAFLIRQCYDDERFDYYNSFIEKRIKIGYSDEKYIFLVLNSQNNDLSKLEIKNYLLSFFKKRKYTYFINLYEKTFIEDFNLNNNYDDEEIRNYLMYMYFHSLLELGEYPKAIDFFNNEDLWVSNITLLDHKTFSFDFNFDSADLYHFQAEYENAIEQYQILKRDEKNSLKNNLKCQWAIAHCYRHMGSEKDLIYSLSISDSICEKTSSKKELFNLYLRNKMSIIMINLYLKNTNYDYEKQFNRLIQKCNQYFLDNKKNEILNSRQRAIFYKIIKKDYDTACKMLYSSIQELENKNLRIKYDYYFEIAEVYRKKALINISNEYLTISKKYYEKSLRFAKRVNDVNLEMINQLGIIISNIQNEILEEKQLNIILKIEQFAKEKKIFYILNWCASIREYLTIALHDKSNSRVNYLYEKVVNIDLFVM